MSAHTSEGMGFLGSLARAEANRVQAQRAQRALDRALMAKGSIAPHAIAHLQEEAERAESRRIRARRELDDRKKPAVLA